MGAGGFLPPACREVGASWSAGAAACQESEEGGRRYHKHSIDPMGIVNQHSKALPAGKKAFFLELGAAAVQRNKCWLLVCSVACVWR